MAERGHQLGPVAGHRHFLGPGCGLDGDVALAGFVPHPGQRLIDQRAHSHGPQAPGRLDLRPVQADEVLHHLGQR